MDVRNVEKSPDFRFRRLLDRHVVRQQDGVCRYVPLPDAGGLDKDTTEEILHNTFVTFGEISDIQLPKVSEGGTWLPSPSIGEPRLWVHYLYAGGCSGGCN